MNIADVTLSYPYVEYTVRVSHFTARKPTAIEWLILEAINKVSVMPNYEGVPVATLFEQIFMISDADLLIRPCLLLLQDMEAIDAVGVSDDTELSTIPMRNLKLTEKGASMQRDGLLPGALDDNNFQIYYDPAKCILFETAESRYKDEPAGISTQEIEAVDSILFPVALIQQLLQRKQENYSAHSRFSWLMPTTRIDSIENSGANILWKNVVKKFQMGSHFECSIVGVDDPDLNAAALNSLTFENKHSSDDLPYVTFVSPDEDIREIVEINDLGSKINACLKSSDLCIVREKYYSDAVFRQGRKNKRLKIAFVSEAKEFKVDMQGGVLVVSVLENILEPGMIYGNATETFCIGKFPLKVQDHRRDTTFVYIPTAQMNVAEICSDLAIRYGSKDYRTLFVLYEEGLKEMFVDEVKHLVSNQESISERAGLIDKINQISIQVYNQKCLLPEFIKESLLVEDYILASCTSINNMLALLAEYEKVSVFMQQDELYKALLKCALPHIPTPENISEIWELWEHIKAVKKAHMTWIGQSGLYQSLYNDRLLKKLLEDFGSDEFELDNYTPVEQIVAQLRRISLRTQEKLPEVDFNTDISDESIREAVLKHKSDLSVLNEEIRNWNEELNKFEAKVCLTETVCDSNSHFSRVITLMERIADALSIFFVDSAIKFSRIYIVDTCTLMNDPDLLAKFEDGKAMLIVPQIVLTELDGLKDSDDENKAYCARAAIRAINNHQAFDWLNPKEVSCPELLNSDLGDPQQPDNKILSIAIKYIIKKPILLTDDTNLRNKAEAQGIDSIDLHGFEMAKAHAAPEHLESKKKKKKR